MNHARRSVAILLTVLTTHVGLAMIAAASEPTADDAHAALQRHKFPWYDATKDAFRPVRALKEPAKPSKGSPSSGVSNGPTATGLGRTLKDPAKSPNADPNSSGVSTGPTAVANVLMWTLLAVTIAGLLIVLIRSMRNFPQDTDSSAKSTNAAVDLEALPEPTRRVGDLLAEAARLASQSSYESAITFYYSWQLVQLDRQQLIEVQKGKTNRQYSREVAAVRPELSGTFGQSIRLFEDAFFGDLPVTREDFQQVWEQRDRFNSPLRRPRT